MNKILYKLIKRRNKRLATISEGFVRHLNDKTYDVILKAFNDEMDASAENSKTDLEILFPMPLEGHEVHFKRCLDAKMSFCICLLKEITTESYLRDYCLGKAVINL